MNSQGTVAHIKGRFLPYGTNIQFRGTYTIFQVVSDQLWEQDSQTESQIYVS